MDSVKQPIDVDVRVVARLLSDRAKLCWTLYVAMAVVGVTAGYMAQLEWSCSAALSVVGLCAFVLSQLCEVSSAHLHARGQRALADADIADSLGWVPSAESKRDLDLAFARSRGYRQLAARDDGPYCASPRPPGPERAWENLHESAWFTWRLAGGLAVWMIALGLCAWASLVLGCSSD